MGQRAPYDPPDYQSRGPVSDPKCANEVSEFFIDGMRNRMAVSFYKYGAVALGYPERVGALDSIAARLQRYADTGNAEWLMDVANFCMIEFMHPAHPQAHFVGTDADQSPGRVEKVSGELVGWRNNEMFA